MKDVSIDNELARLDTGIELAIDGAEVAKCAFESVKRVAIFFYGVACYLVFLVTFAYTVGFIGDFAVPKTIDTGTDAHFIQALLVDLSLVALFGLQHSLMARTTFKRTLTSFIPAAAERSTFVLASSAALLLIIWLWQPIPQVVWSVRDPVGMTVLYALFMLGWVVVLVTTFLINHFDFSGLAQVYAYLRGKAYQPPGFKAPLFYRYVRHPMMTGLLIGLWVAPQMTMGHLLFAAGMTLYILIGVTLEERSLIQSLGKAYEVYRTRTPMFLPLPRTMHENIALSGQTAETVRSRLLRMLFNCWPAIRGTGIRVTYVAPEMLEIHVSLSLTFHTLNPMGTIFGGSIYAACDPWYTTILMRQLGPGYVVWDKAASIQFKKPGRSTLSGRFSIDSAEVMEIRRLLETEHSVNRVYHADLVSNDGAVIASVEKVVYVRRDNRKQQISNPMLRLVRRVVLGF